MAERQADLIPVVQRSYDLLQARRRVLLGLEQHPPPRPG